jgi:LPS-assembly protein
MRRAVVLSLVVSACLFAGDRVEVFGTFTDVNGSIAHVGGDPIITYKDEILSADDIFYDQNTSIVEAKGSVSIFKAGQYHVISDYSSYNIPAETRYSKPFYMIDQKMGLWMSTAEAEGCKNEIDMAKGSLSGCDSTNPLWKIRFTSATYDTSKMWMNLYNPRLYVKNTPVFYLPYFGYPTDNTRRSGLLMPTYGFSNGEGFYYQQPIYIAPQNWWDLELRPQIRTSRGAGIYGDYRFVDSPYSKGSVRMGYFKEQSEYAALHDLAHIKHYGYNVDYRNSAFLKEWFGIGLAGESGLFIRGGAMSDVDYLNLQHTDQIYNITANQVLSRMNSYYNDEDNYYGMYVKYYQYLNQASNRQTIQTLPTLQYHRYLENFFGDHLLLNSDMRVNNFYRPEGKRAVQGDLTVPVTLQTSLFNGYIDASYTAKSSVRMIGFYGNERPDETGSTYDKGTYSQIDHVFKIGSTLVRPYETLTHVIAPEVSYFNAGSRLYSGYYKTYHGACTVGNTDPACEFYTLNEPTNTLAFAVNNYLFEKGKQLVADRLSQNFSHDQQGSYYGELQNELEWQISSAVSYYNQTAFNHDRDRVTKEQNTVRYNGSGITAGVSHYYTDNLINNSAVYASYWTADVAYQYNRFYKYFGLVAYDYRANLLKRGEVGFLYTTRCLDFGIKFVQNIRPIVTTVNANGSVNDSYIFFTIVLKPIGGYGFNYKLTNN